jgi:hypothetical protein
VRACSGNGCDSFGDLFLQQEHGAAEQRTQGERLFNNGRGDVVGKISYYGDGSPLSEVGFENVALDEGEARLVAEFGAKILDQDWIDFDGDDSSRVGEQMGGEGTAAGSDFDYWVGGFSARRFGDAFQDLLSN